MMLNARRSALLPRSFMLGLAALSFVGCGSSAQSGSRDQYIHAANQICDDSAAKTSRLSSRNSEFPNTVKTTLVIFKGRRAALGGLTPPNDLAEGHRTLLQREDARVAYVERVEKVVNAIQQDRSMSDSNRLTTIGGVADGAAVNLGDLTRAIFDEARILGLEACQARP